MDQLMDIVIQSSGWFFVLILYVFLGIIMGNKMSKLWGNSDDLRWVTMGITLSVFVAYPATFYLFYAMKASPVQ